MSSGVQLAQRIGAAALKAEARSQRRRIAAQFRSLNTFITPSRCADATKYHLICCRCVPLRRSQLCAVLHHFSSISSITLHSCLEASGDSNGDRNCLRPCMVILSLPCSHSGVRWRGDCKVLPFSPITPSINVFLYMQYFTAKSSGTSFCCDADIQSMWCRDPIQGSVTAKVQS